MDGHSVELGPVVKAGKEEKHEITIIYKDPGVLKEYAPRGFLNTRNIQNAGAQVCTINLLKAETFFFYYI